MLKQKIHIAIEHKKCLGRNCLHCVDSCPVEAIDWDPIEEQVSDANFQECIVCLACEEACTEDGNQCLTMENVIRKEFKPSPIQDMWAGTVEVKPPKADLPAGRSDTRTSKMGF
jgi:ferredoxin